MSAHVDYLPAFLRTRQHLLPLLILISLIMTGNGIVAPILPVYAEHFGVGGTLIGMMITLFGVGRLIANIPAGILSERFGRRPFLCLGPALIAIGGVGAAMSGNFEMLLMFRFVQGIGSGIYMTISATVLAETTRSGERGRVMAFYQGSLLVGAGIGPAIGGFVALHFGYSAPFWAYAGVAVVTFLVAFATFQEPPRHGHEHSRQSPEARPRFRSFATEPLFLMLCVITFGVFFTRTASQWLIIPFVGHDRFGLSVDIIGLALGASAFANFLMLPIVGPAVDRFGARPITVASTILTGLALSLMAVSSSPILYWAGLILLGISSGFNGPAVAAATADILPAGLFGPAMGMQRAVGDAGFVLGPILVGLVYDLTSAGYTGALVGNAALMMVAGLTLAGGIGRTASSTKPAE